MPVKEAREIQEGKRLDVTLTADVEGGDVIPYGTSMCVVAATAGLTGETIAAETGKVWEVNANTADAFAVGDEVFFHPTNRELTITAAGAVRFGRAVSAKTATVAGAVKAKLNAV